MDRGWKKGVLGMKKDTERFQRVYTQGTMQGMQIWVDKETGVKYLFHFAGYRGGLTPLLDGEGKPIITPVSKR